MFTGLIQHVGTVVSASSSTTGIRLIVDGQGWLHRPTEGDSIAVAGCCLTLVPSQEGMLAFDVIPQTLQLTTLGTLGAGQQVNLEAAMGAQGRLDGHVVQGHVDATGTVVAVKIAPEEGHRVQVQVAHGVLALCVEQGSITLDGVSLTIAGMGPETLEVALIPTTISDTTLGALEVGDQVNVETDVLARHVARLVEAQVERAMQRRTVGD